MAQGRLLALAEACFPHVLEDRGDGGAAAFDHRLVHIVELQPEALCQTLAEGGLAGAHGADQDQVGGGIHGP